MATGERGTLTPGVVLPRLTGRFGEPYAYAEVCESTQQCLGADSAEGAVAVCEEQTAGRGRLGRAWAAPARTAILCSIALRPAPHRVAAELSLVAGLAVALTVENEAGRPAQIKWPNDVLLDGGKVAGVLAEMRGSAVILGIGLNVNQETADLPPRVPFPTASLRAVDGRTRDRASILAFLLARLEETYDEWLSRGLAAALPELTARDALRGRGVTVGGVRGVAAGIASDGRLQLETTDGRMLAAAGEVTIDTL